MLEDAAAAGVGSQAERAGSTLERWVVVAAVAVAALVPPIYVIAHLNEFADGAYITLVATSDDPWRFFWANFPARYTAYLISGGAPHVVQLLTGSPRLAVLTYQLLWSIVPLLSLLACRLILPKGRRSQLIYPAASFCTLAIALSGFPSEVWLTHGLAWPLFFALANWQRTPSHLVGLWVVAAMFAFTHEMMVLAAVPLAATAWRADRADGTLVGWRLPPVVVCVVGAVLTSRLVLAPDPAMRGAVAQNGRGALRLDALLPPLVVVAAFVLVASVGVQLLVRRYAGTWLGVGRSTLAAQVVALVLALALALAADGISYADHYLARTAVAAGLALWLAVGFVELGPPAPGHLRSAGRWLRRAVVWASLPVLALQVVAQARFVAAFVSYREALVSIVTDPTVAVPAPPLETYPPAEEGQPREVDPRFSHGIGWGWSMVFQSALLSLDHHVHRLLLVASPDSAEKSEAETADTRGCSGPSPFTALPDDVRRLLTAYSCGGDL